MSNDKRIMTDGGTDSPSVGDGGGGIGDSDAAIQRAEELAGGTGWDAAVAHSQYVLHAYKGDERQAQQAQQQWDRQRTRNSQLRKDEWTVIDDSVMETARRQRVMLGDLIDAGLSVPLDLGTLRWEWESLSDMDDAQVDMGAETGGAEDLPGFSTEGVPLPIVHKSFLINRRKLRASRNRGEPLDTTAARQATRVVNDKLEDIVANGLANLSVEGDQVYGYTNHPDRNIVSGSDWSTGTTSAEDMINDVLAAVEAVEDDNRGQMGMTFYFGRQAFQTIRATNVNADNERGVLDVVTDRLGNEDGFPGINIRQAPHLDDNEGVLVELSQETVQLAVPSDVQVLEWESKGGMTVHNKVMASQIPVIKSDDSGQIGLAHLEGITL